MKKYIAQILIAVIATFAVISCTNDSVAIQKQVQITISPSKVLKDIVPYESSHLEMYKEDGVTAKLKLVALIYDSNGDLYHQSEKIVKDYNSDYTFSVLVNDEKYRVLAYSYSVFEENGESYSAYSITNTNKIEKLNIVQEYFDSWSSNFSILGMYDATTSLSENMHIDLSMATSYVYMRWFNIHADSKISTGSSSIYGEYSATATDYWGSNTYSWTISVEQDYSRTNGVIVKDLCPVIYDAGLTSEEGYNTYYGYIEDDFLIIETGQETGATSDGNVITMEGLFVYDGETYESDIMFYIEDGALTLVTYFGSWNEGGWFSLFEPDLVFNSVGGGSGVDSYTYLMKLYDKLSFTDNGHKYSTTLDANSYFIFPLEPTDYPNSNNIQGLRNFFPGTFEVYMKESVGNESEEYCKQQITLEPGKQYCLEYDCETKQMNFISGVSRTRSYTIIDNINKSFRPFNYNKELRPTSLYPLLRK